MYIDLWCPYGLVSPTYNMIPAIWYENFHSIWFQYPIFGTSVRAYTDKQRGREELYISISSVRALLLAAYLWERCIFCHTILFCVLTVLHPKPIIWASHLASVNTLAVPLGPLGRTFLLQVVLAQEYRIPSDSSMTQCKCSCLAKESGIRFPGSSIPLSPTARVLVQILLCCSHKEGHIPAFHQ